MIEELRSYSNDTCRCVNKQIYGGLVLHMRVTVPERRSGGLAPASSDDAVAGLAPGLPPPALPKKRLSFASPGGTSPAPYIRRFAGVAG